MMSHQRQPSYQFTPTHTHLRQGVQGHQDTRAAGGKQLQHPHGLLLQRSCRRDGDGPQLEPPPLPPLPLLRPRCCAFRRAATALLCSRCCAAAGRGGGWLHEFGRGAAPLGAALWLGALPAGCKEVQEQGHDGTGAVLGGGAALRANGEQGVAEG